MHAKPASLCCQPNGRSSGCISLLARRLAAGRITDAVAERHAVEDLWRDPLINQR